MINSLECVYLLKNLYWYEKVRKITFLKATFNDYGFKLYLCDTLASITRRAYIGADLI